MLIKAETTNKEGKSLLNTSKFNFANPNNRMAKTNNLIIVFLISLFLILKREKP